MIDKREIPSLICFVGIDGSGKTTLAMNLDKTLREMGYRSKYVHALIKPILLRPLMAIGRMLFASGKSKYGNYTEFRDAKKRGMRRHGYLVKPYYWLLMLDYYPQVFFKIVVPKLFGKTVICDRFLFDTILNLGINLSYDTGMNNSLIKKAFRYFPKPSKIILVDTPIETAFSRKDDIPDKHYLADRRTLYLGLTNSFPIAVVDGSKNINELNQEILSIVLGNQNSGSGF